MRLRGRENSLVDVALTVFKRFADKAWLDYERPPQKMGNQIIAMLARRKEIKEEKKDETQNPQSNNQKS